MIFTCNGSPAHSITFIEVCSQSIPDARTNPMNEITKLLKAWKSGDKEALEKLMTLILPELKRIAHKYMSAEKPGNILQTTALVNEALIKLISEKISFEDRKQFYRVVARRMR